MKIRDIIKLLQHDGWRIDRVRGSHRQFVHLVKPGTVTVAGHPSMELHPKTLKSIFTQAGLKRQ